MSDCISRMSEAREELLEVSYILNSMSKAHDILGNSELSDKVYELSHLVEKNAIAMNNIFGEYIHDRCENSKAMAGKTIEMALNHVLREGQS